MINHQDHTQPPAHPQPTTHVNPTPPATTGWNQLIEVAGLAGRGHRNFNEVVRILVGQRIVAGQPIVAVRS
jgi:hypothetical protein